MNHSSDTRRTQSDERARTLALDGERVRTLRLHAGMTRESLSAKSSGANALSVATLKRAEAGKPIYASSAAALSQLLDVPLSQLMASAANETIPSQGEPQRPAAIAVMPFDIGVADEQTQVFANGFAEDIINRLSSAWFPVIARASSFSWQSESREPPDAHRILGAHYALRGSVRSDGARYRISTQLIETEAERVVWAGNFDTTPTALFEVRDQIVSEVVSEAGNRVFEEQASRAAKLEPGDLGAWHLALRGAWHFYRETPADMLQARTFLDQALVRDPHLAFARYLLMLSYQHELLNQWSADTAATVAAMQQCGLDFERACPSNAFMYVATSCAAVAAGDRADAEERLLEALLADPNLVPAHSLYGQVLAMRGQCDQGLHELGLARRLSPRDPGAWAMLATTSLAHFAAGRYDAAVEWAQRAVVKRPQVPFVYAALAASLALRGDIREARDALAKLAKRNGRLGLRGMQAVMGSTDPDIAARFIDGLRLAGIHETG